jgi:hypothetical protein
MRTSSAARRAQRELASTERARRETSALLYRLGFPKCACECGRTADTIVLSGDAQVPMAHSCALQARRVSA